MSETKERLHKLFSTMPVKGVFGNYGEASRYRLMEKLAGGIPGQDGSWIKMVRDKKTVILYPAIYGDQVYVPGDGRGYGVSDFARLEEEEDSQEILVPAKGIKGNYLVEFPALCEDVYGPVFGESYMQGLFFEAFPYDKKSFEEMAAHIIAQSPSRMPVRIVLVKNEVQYGATDVTSQDTAIKKAVESMKKYTAEKILVYRDRDIDGSLLDFHIDMKNQHILKKRRAVEKAKEELEQYFDGEFKEARERYFMEENGQVPGILSSMCFAKAAEYQRVKGKGSNIESAVFHNYMEQVVLAKENLKGFYRWLWDRFLYEIALLSREEEEQWARRWMEELRREYRPKTVTYCPDSSIEYRKRVAGNKIVIRLEEYVNDFVEHGLKQSVYERMKREIRKCEERYA